MSVNSLPSLPSSYAAPRYAKANASPAQTGDQTRFGVCADPCSCPCSCLSGLVSAGALALAGLGAIKLGPKVIKQAGKWFSPEKMSQLSSRLKQLPNQFEQFKQLPPAPSSVNP
jgi:hypothetical protein